MKLTPKLGLDRHAVCRIRTGNYPRLPACILLTDHFGAKQNVLLELAGWPRLEAFDIKAYSAKGLRVKAANAAKEIARNSDPQKRKPVANAVLALDQRYSVPDD